LALDVDPPGTARFGAWIALLEGGVSDADARCPYQKPRTD
jgi:hypothetical protein